MKIRNFSYLVERLETVHLDEEKRNRLTDKSTKLRIKKQRETLRRHRAARSLTDTDQLSHRTRAKIDRENGIHKPELTDDRRELLRKKLANVQTRPLTHPDVQPTAPPTIQDVATELDPVQPTVQDTSNTKEDGWRAASGGTTPLSIPPPGKWDPAPKPDILLQQQNAINFKPAVQNKLNNILRQFTVRK